LSRVSTPDLTEPACFAEAYRRLLPAARAAARGVLKDEAAAEDVAQEVFTSLWRNPRSYDMRRGSLERFVTLMARSRALDQWRSRSAHAAAVERTRHQLPGPGQAPGADEQAARREGAHRVLHGLAGVPDSQREALVMSMGGLTLREVAEQTGVPVGTAKSRVRAGLAKVRADATD
jgi:RNA polymerase sigma-70 factor, ECF subfamily